ncbi:MAG: hypothetical protein ACYC09_04305 [Bacteroidota bacterium]
MKNNRDIPEQFTVQLKEAIQSLLVDELSPAQESFLIDAAHKLATTLVRIKFSTTPSLRHILGLNERDLGYDCIADLFERDDKERLVHFKTYFSNFDILALSQKEILMHFNRLITSAVNQNLMHVFRDFDPSLGKIIRNIKLAVTAHKAFLEIDRFDEVCIAPIHCTLNEHLPTADLDFLVSLLQPAVRGDEFIPELLSVFSRNIREQEEYNRIVPLISVALAFRTLLTLKQHTGTNFSFNDSFEIRNVIEESVTRVEKKFTLDTSSSKESNEHEQIYFRTIRDVLLIKTHQGNGTVESLYEVLKHNLNGLTHHQYLHYHRSRLEYFYRLCREEIAYTLVEKKKGSGH